MNIKRSINKRISKIFGTVLVNPEDVPVINFYKTDYNRSVLISYITYPFHKDNHFSHQNYITSHIIAESFFELGYNVDIVNYNDRVSNIDYGKYSVIFGFGYRLENSFYHSDRSAPRILFVTGVHEELLNMMSLQSVKDFYELSGLWLPDESQVISDSTYYSHFNADFAVILAEGFVYADYKARFNNELYRLNNNIIGSFSQFTLKTAESRTKNFLFLCGCKLIKKGIHILMETAKLRTDLNFYIVVPSMDSHIEDYYHKTLYGSSNVFFYKNIRMDSVEMKQIIENCSYSLAPSYADGFPGGTIEPMSAGVIPIVSKYCGFAEKKFIFEMEDLSPVGLNDAIERVLALDDRTYAEYSSLVKEYTLNNFSVAAVKSDLLMLLKKELKDI
ncbi:glycosyltransferase [Pedobacter sp. PAMC26386]|nr:glycosyltransferase [Pedobacter sp. PAMC26386]